MLRISVTVLSLATLAIAGLYSNSQQEVVTKEDTRTRRLFCPRYPNGEMCQENSMWTYYSCCGENNDRCCGYTRTWVWVVSSAIALMLLLLLVGFLLKKFYFDRRREGRDHYVSGVRRTEVKA